MKKVSKRMLSAIIAMVMLVSMLPNSAFKASATPAVSQSDYVTGDIIEYGSYPQTKVTNSVLITALNAQTLQADSTVTYDGSKYMRVYFTTPTNVYQAANGYNINTVYWFKFEPIQWRILSNTDGELFVTSEKILDTKAYNQDYSDVTWETCTIRSWLNNDFYNNAFNPVEKANLSTTMIDNSGNPWYSDGGNLTFDKLFLLSYSDTINTSYGFSSLCEASDNARMAQGSDYAKSSGLNVETDNRYLGNSSWWLRSPGLCQDGACIGTTSGSVDPSYSSPVNSEGVGVRPAFITSMPIVNITLNGIALEDIKQIKVLWYRSYKNSKNDIQLGFLTNMGTDVTAVWSSDNPSKVQVDQTGKIRNLKTGARSAKITVNLVDSENNVIATDSVKIVFYKFKWQLKNL